MYGLNRLRSANHLLALFNGAATTTAATYPKRLLRSESFTHSSRRRVVDPPSSSAGIDYFVYVGEGGKILGKEENEGAISDINNTFEISISKNSQNNTFERKVLPPELFSRNVAMLTCDSAADGGICDVYVVGSDHNSTVVFLELCSSRVHVLTHQNIKVPTMREMINRWKKNDDPLWILYCWSRAKNDSKYEHVLGGEFPVAYEQAMKYGAKVVLGDLPTEFLVFSFLVDWIAEKIGQDVDVGILFHPHSVHIPEDLVKMAKDEIDYINLVVQEVGKKFPTSVEVDIERDRYMSANLLQVARRHNSVVAVVGKGHLAGIQKNWKQPVDMEELLKKKTITMGRILSSIGAMVVYLSLPASQISKIQENIGIFSNSN